MNSEGRVLGGRSYGGGGGGDWGFFCLGEGSEERQSGCRREGQGSVR